MVPSPVDPTAWDGLREHDREVLEFLSREPFTHVAFQGIRRHLGIHPEQLSRALRRLAEDGLIEKTEIGYRVVPRAKALLSPVEWPSEPTGIALLRTYLPENVDVRGLANALKGSWIGPLRWYGLTETPGEVRLTWSVEDGSIQVDVRTRAGELEIRARLLSPDRLDEATRLGHLLFRHVADATASSDRAYSGLVT